MSVSPWKTYRTETQLAASERLHCDVMEWIDTCRLMGYTWAQIRIALAEQGGPIVKSSTLQRWYAYWKSGR